MILKMDDRYWLWGVFWGCVVITDGVWPMDGGTSFVVMTQFLSVMRVTAGSNDVFGHIGLFCCPEGSLAVSFEILKVN